MKVVNPAGATGRLRVDSPNAQPVPHAPAEAVEDRWLGMDAFDGQPLRPALGGLPLEYRIVQLYSRDAGRRAARLDVGLVPADSKPLKTDRGAEYVKVPNAGSVEVTFDAAPSVPATFEVADGGRPPMAAFEIRDALGRVYPLPSKRLAPDFFFHPQVYRGTGETVRLPAGTYAVRCSRGPESVPETKTLAVGREPVTLRYEVRRWVEPTKLGYWSGDHHIHAAGCQHYDSPTQGVRPEDMMRHCMGEDLDVGCCLTWGPCFDFQKQFFSGKVDAVSTPPYLLRYDVEVSGFGSHESGHLNLLRLREQI